MGLENGAARGLRRVRCQNELDAEPGARCLELRFVDPAAVELGKRLGERLARDAPLGLVLAAAADPVVLLGDVDELEEEREGPLHGGLALQPECSDRIG